MKKKIFFGVLGAAVVAMGTFVSCNDKEEDRFLDFQQSIKDRTQDPLGIYALIDDLSEKLDAAQAECKALHDADAAAIAALQARLEAVESDYVTKAQLEQELSAYYVKEEVDALVNNKIAEAKAQLEALIDGKVAELDAKIAANSASISELFTLVDGLVKDLAAVKATADEALSVANQALTLAQDNQAEIAKLKESLDGLGISLDGLGAYLTELAGRIGTLETDLAALTEKVNTNEQKIAALEEAYKKADEALKAELKDEIDALRKQHEEDLAALQELLEGEINDLRSEIQAWVTTEVLDIVENMIQTDLEVAIAAVRDYFQGVVDNLADRLDAANAAIATLEGRVDELSTKLADLTTSVGKIEATLDNMVTSVVAQATENPVFGSFSLPVGIRSQMLAAYYGDMAYEIDFPLSADVAPVVKNNVFVQDGSADLMKGVKIGKSETIYAGKLVSPAKLDDGIGNAGRLFFTVNGTYKDLSKVHFSLVNSRDEESPLDLDNNSIKASDVELSFGSRTGNNFFEAPIMLREENIADAKVKIDMDAMKSLGKSLLNAEDRDLATVVSTLYNELSNIMPAYAIKATWKDGNDQEQNVYSQYALATTAIQGLGYGFAKDINPKMPNIIDVDQIVENVFGSIKGVFNGLKESIGNFTIPSVSIDFPELPDGAFKAVVNFGDGQFNGVENVVNIWTVTLDVREDQNDGSNGVSENIVTRTFIFTDFDSLWHYNKDAKVYARWPGRESTQGAGFQERYMHDWVGSSIWGNYDYNSSYDRDWLKANPSGRFVYTPEGTLSGSVTIDFTSEMQDLLQDMNDELAALVQALQDNFNSLFAQFGEAESTLEGIQGELTDQLNKYLSRIGKLYTTILSPNNYLKPILLAQTGNSFVRLSTSATRPTVVKGTELVVTPTSYTAEILAPAYKRYLQVRELNTEEAIDEQIVNGIENAFEKVTLTAGKTYEVIYQALDYSGQVIVKKAYLKVEK